jgi:hypothetical protein
MVMAFSLKIGDAFIREEQLRSMVSGLARKLDQDNLEGALYFTVDGREILGEQEWDVIDSLLAYIINDIEAAIGGKEFTTYFPDQPLELKIKTVHDKVTISVNNKKAVVDREDFFRVLYSLCKRFFDLMMAVYPSGWYAPYETRLKKLLLQHPWLAESASGSPNKPNKVDS